MKANTYLIFNGNCREAAIYYGEIFGKTPEMMTFAEMPPDPETPVSKEMEDKILHAEIALDNNDVLMMSDIMPGMPHTIGDNFSIVISSKDPQEIRNLYEKLKKGSEVVMELQKTFWSPCFGEVKDRFGVSWMFNCDMA